MKTNESLILAAVRRKSSAILLKQIEEGRLLKERQTALLVLKQRGVDVSKYTSEVLPEETQSISPEKVKEVSSAIDKICECDSDEIKEEAGNILENITEYSNLSLLQSDALLELASKIPVKKSSKKVEVSEEKPVAPAAKAPVQTTSTTQTKKEVTPLTPRESVFVDEQMKKLSEKVLTKKELIYSFIESGLQRSQVTKLITKGLIDETYVYDLYKAYEKASAK